MATSSVYTGYAAYGRLAYQDITILNSSMEKMDSDITVASCMSS